MDRPVANQTTPETALPALHTPLIWAWGGAMLTATLWLTSIIALFRSFGSLFS